VTESHSLRTFIHPPWVVFVWYNICMKITNTEISWEAPEYHPANKKKAWYWALGIVAITLVIVALILKNWLLAILIGLGAFVLAIMSSRKPAEITFRINERGLQIGKQLISFDNIEAFWISETDEDEEYHEIFINKLDGVHQFELLLFDKKSDPEFLRSTLREYIPEHPMTEPLSQRIAHWIGL